MGQQPNRIIALLGGLPNRIIALLGGFSIVKVLWVLSLLHVDESGKNSIYIRFFIKTSCLFKSTGILFVNEASPDILKMALVVMF